MPAENPARKGTEFVSAQPELVEWLHSKAQGARWGVTRARFAQALQRSLESRFRGASPTPVEVAAYLETLHAEDLALACACSDGHEKAWEHFLQHYRQELYAAARAILGGRAHGGGEARARELADSIYAELFMGSSAGDARGSGSSESDGALAGAGSHRRPLLDYYHGRSKLSTWLRAVLAQRHVDSLRAGRRTESLDAPDLGPDGQARQRELRDPRPAPDPERAQLLSLLQGALQEALAGLEPRDRLRLAFYYVQELTLAEIGRILGEHEATVSRKLESTRRDLRSQVLRALTTQKGLSEAQIHVCLEYAVEEYPFDLTRALSRETPDPQREND